MPEPDKSNPKKYRRMRGFERTSSLLQTRIRETAESRGFAESRVLTHWDEIVGEKTARMARPVKMSYGRGGFGATLTLLTTGSMAPMLQAQLPAIRDRVNACYGYNAISRIHITQTAPVGFSEGRVAFDQAPKAEPRKVSPEVIQNAASLADGVSDPKMREALERLGRNVLSRNNKH